MSNLVKVNDQLMGLTISELTQVQSMIAEKKAIVDEFETQMEEEAEAFEIQKAAENGTKLF